MADSHVASGCCRNATRTWCAISLLAGCLVPAACGEGVDDPSSEPTDSGISDATQDERDSGNDVNDAPADQTDVAVEDRNDGSDDDVGEASTSFCEHHQKCSTIGKTCSNSCDEPCTCADEVTPPWWNCEIPLQGALCSKPQATCEYPPSTNSDIVTCDCVAPEGEYFWSCGGSSSLKSVCP